MAKWITVHDTRENRPPEIDETSSRYTVYVRKNIRQEDILDRDSMGDPEVEPKKAWVYEETTYTQEEWKSFNSLQTESLMQALTEQTSDIVTANMMDTKPDEIKEEIMQVVNQSLNDMTADIVSVILTIGG